MQLRRDERHSRGQISHLRAPFHAGQRSTPKTRGQACEKAIENNPEAHAIEWNVDHALRLSYHGFAVCTAHPHLVHAWWGVCDAGLIRGDEAVGGACETHAGLRGQ